MSASQPDSTMNDMILGALRCPICDSALSEQGKSLVCLVNHCFDISKEGYINLSLGAAPSKYDKALFTSRRAIHKLGFFTPLVDAIVRITTTARLGDPQLILDAGCGEGSLLNDVIARTTSEGIGIDIAKEGVRMAAKHFKAPLWLCADLARMPIQDNSIDVLLNILSPANYSEFTRILRPGGLLMKAIPGTDHLCEIREAIDDKGEYSNEDVLRLYNEHFKDTKTVEIKQTLTLDKEAASHLVRMTPLSWSRNIDDHVTATIRTATLHILLLVSTRNATAPE